MREIQLTKGKVALVDDEDYERLKRWKWSATQNAARGNEKWYAIRREVRDEKKVGIYMHRFIVGAPSNFVVDHRNGDGLDNRRENLRTMTQEENTRHCRFKPKPKPAEPWL